MAEKKGDRLAESHDEQVRTLYQNLLESWNEQDASGYAALFTEDGNIIGFDGSQANGKKEIFEHLSDVFNHKTAAYVSIIREIRFLTKKVALLRAVAGMIPPGESDIKPEVNAIQTLIAKKQENSWRIAVLHNTPAAFHNHPELREKLTEELRETLHATV